jgi:glycosyltransferase involved in cell wall biosynthesis
MKIAIDIRSAGREKTGKGWYTFNLVSEIIKQDRDNDYIFYTDNAKQPFGSHKNVTVKVFPLKSWRWHIKVLNDLRMEKPNLFFSPSSYIIPAFASKSLKTIITVHDLAAFLYPGAYPAKAILIERMTLRQALKKVSAVFTVSENTKKDLLRKFKIKADIVHLTPCAPSTFFRQPLSEKDLEAVKKSLKLPDKFILGVGTMEPRKNFNTLIKSFVIIKRNYPDYKLVIVGKKGWNFGLIEHALKHYKMEKDVLFTGYLHDHELQKVYALAKVFVFPSLYEGFGIPPLEAMASGCPVVSSNSSSLPEVVGQGGLLIDARSAVKIADAVCSLLADEQIRLMMIERGKIQEKRFQWADSAKKALEVFRSLA